MSKLIITIIMCLCFALPSFAVNLDKERCQDDRIVLIIGIMKDNKLSYGHGFIIDNNKIMTATHVVYGDFEYVAVVIKGKPILIRQNQVNYIDNKISVISVNTGSVPHYTRGYVKKGDRLKISSCLKNSYGSAFALASSSLVSDSYVTHGWSGSPVLNSKGQVIGIAEAFLNLDGKDSFQGVSIITRIDKSCKINY